MANGYTLLLRNGSMVAPKICSSMFRYDALVEFACSKWYDLNGPNFGLTYVMDTVGECVVKDDDDMAAMFSLATQQQLERIDVYVRKVDEVSGGPLVLFDDDLLDSCIKYNRETVECEQAQAITQVPSRAKNLISRDWRNMIDDVGQEFVGGAESFRKALVKFSIEIGFEFTYVKNDSERVTAECRFKDMLMCPWRIHASIDKSTDRFIIRTYNKDHKCNKNFSTARKTKFNRKVIIDLITDDIRNMPGISPRDIQSQVMDKFGVEISYYVAWRATDAGRSKIFGDHTESYSQLPAYIAAVEKSNPDSVLHLDLNPIKKNFRRCFFAFGACIHGFQYCRPVLMVDGTFLKGKHKGVLLSAVGKDGNEGLYPVAFAIVSEENDSNWEYFLQYLKVAVGTSRVLTFVSDRQHGIIAGVKNVFPDAVHGFCYKHLTSNLKHKFRGTAKIKREKILKQFADCAYAATKEEFDRYFLKLKATGGASITRWLADLPKETWSNAYFIGRRYGQMTSNGCESWNAQIRDKRALPITKLIDGIRMLLMKQMADRRQNAATWNTILCKHVDTQMNEFIEISRPWLVHPASEVVWEVFSSPSAVVDLAAGSCSCRMWQITCLPCVHAAKVIFLKMSAAYEYVDHCYHRSTYMKSYSGAIIPFAQPEVDPTSVVIGPPDFQARRGRPKRKRIPSQGENIPKKIKCGNCRRLGSHNKKSCNKACIED